MSCISMNEQIKYEQEEDLENIDSIQIFSDEEYNHVFQPYLLLAQKQSNSSTQFNHLSGNLHQQQTFVQQKYKKYKRLRRQIQAKIMNIELPQAKEESQESLSSFSGSSLSSDSQQKENPDGINKETLLSIVKSFQTMQQPRENFLQQPITFKKIGQEHKITQDYIENMFYTWKKDSSFGGRASNSQKDNASSIGSTQNKEQKSKRISLVPTQAELNEMRAKTIEELLTQNPFLSQNQIFLELNKITHLKSIKFGKFRQISRTIVTKLLSQGPFKQTRLRVLHPDRNEPIIVHLRHIFCNFLLKKINSRKNNIVLFLDEHSFELFQAKDCMWVRPDQNNKHRESFIKHQFSLLALFDLRGGAYWKISSHGKDKYDDFQGFYSLFQQAIESIRQVKDIKSIQSSEKSCKLPQVYLVMNSSIQFNIQKVHQYEKAMKAKIICLPQFSTQLSPIQQWFQQLRHRIRHNSYASNEQLLKGVHKMLKEYQSYDYKPLIDESIKQIWRGYRKDRF